MIRIHLLRDVVSWQVADRIDRPWSAGVTAAQLIAEHALECWGRSPRLAVALHGRRLSADELAMPLVDGADLVVVPDPQGIELIITIALSLISVAVNFLSARLMDMPAAALDASERGDQSSQTRAWDRMATEYRPGFPVPLAFGEHDLPGTAIFVDLFAGAGGTNIGPNEELRIALALCEGPVHSIGGIAVDSDDLGATEFQPLLPGQPRTTLPIPSDVRVDGNRIDHTLTPNLQGSPGSEVWRNTPNCRAFVRLGSIDQAPLPAISPRWQLGSFSGSRQTEIVDLDLGDDGSSGIHTISDTDEIANVSCAISFPSGLYDATNASLPPQPVSVSLALRWRPVGTTVWSTPLNRVITEASVAPFAVTVSMAVGTVGPIEVEVRRTSAAAGPGIADRARWRQVTYGFAQEFSYPRTAVLGLVLQAGENATGSRAQFQVFGKWLTVRVWDASIASGQPSSTRYFDPPASGDLYAGIWSFAPGRNPAWILAAFLRHPGGMGRFVRDADIDWPSLRNWADFCDQSVDVNGTPEALCTFDYVLDSATPAQEVLARILQAGRASLITVDGKISAVYRYRDAHGRGSNSVPAKARTQLVTTANVANFSVEFHDTFARPAVITAQFLNRAKDYAQDVIDVHDPRGGHQDPATMRAVQFRKQTVQFYGLTRESQVQRDALFMHAVNALLDHEISFEIGREALAAQVGDLIGCVHDVLRPYDTEAFGLRTTAASDGVAEVRLNKELVLQSGRTYRILVRQVDGSVEERQITSSAGTYAAGDLLTLDTTIDAAKGAMVCFGELGAVVVDYEIAAITLAHGLNRTVRATRWVPEIHDIPDVDELLEDAGGALSGSTAVRSAAFSLADDVAAVRVSDVAVRTLPGRRTEIVWQKPDGFGASRARVHVRLVGSARWWSIGETDGGSLLCDLAIGQAFDVSIVLADRLGRFQLPGSGTLATVTVEEFPAACPPTVTGLRLTQRPRAVRLTWDSQVDVDHYEVRNVGGDWDAWLATPLLARVEEPFCELELQPFWTESQVVRFGVCAISRDGMRSVEVATCDWTPATPVGLWEIDDVHPNPGTGVFARENLSVALASGDFSASAPPALVDRSATGGGRGVVESEVFDIGYDVDAWLAVYWESRAVGAETLDDLGSVTLDSGEAAWRLVDGRPASERSPGLDPSSTLDDLALTMDDAPASLRVGADVGEAGVRAEARMRIRTALSSETISAAPWVDYAGPVRVVHRYAQLRLEVDWIDDGLTSVEVRRVRMRRYA